MTRWSRASGKKVSRMMEVVPTPRTRKPATAERPALFEIAENARTNGTAKLLPERRAELGQYLTPAPIARFVAAMFGPRRGVVRILDAGAGSGSLTAAAVAEHCFRAKKSTKTEATVYEIEPWGRTARRTQSGSMSALYLAVSPTRMSKC